MQRSLSGRVSVAINRVFGGKEDETLCLRWARAWGPYCFFCNLVGAAVRNWWHCFDEMTPADIVAWKRRQIRERTNK